MCRCHFILAAIVGLTTGTAILAADPDLADLRDQLSAQATLLQQQQQVLETQQSELNSLRGLFENGSSKEQFRSGYDKGFFVQSIPDASDSGPVPFRLKFNSWMQLRHSVFDSHGSTADQHDVEFERLRLVFSGHVWSPELKYFIQLDADSDQNESVDMLDYHITYDLAKIFDVAPGNILIRAGKWKMPFNRARAESGWKMQLVDRSLASSFFDINRSLGVGLIVKNEVSGRPVETRVALHNGFKTGAFQPVRAGELDKNIAVSGRMFSDIVGEWEKDGESDLNPHQYPAIRIGGGFAWTQVDNEGLREFRRQRVVDTGAILASLLPASVTAYDIAFYSVDANLKYQGFSMHTEYYFRQIGDFSGATLPVQNDHGLLVQAGCFVIPKRLEAAARFSRIVGDSGTLGGAESSADEIACGLNWYFRGHHAKLQFDVTHLNGAPVSDRALNILPGDNGLLYRTQFQLAF